MSRNSSSRIAFGDLIPFGFEEETGDRVGHLGAGALHRSVGASAGPFGRTGQLGHGRRVEGALIHMYEYMCTPRERTRESKRLSGKEVRRK